MIAKALVLLALVIGASVPAAPVRAKAEQGREATRELYLLLIRQARSDGRPRAALAYLADFDRRYPGSLDARVLKVNCLLDLGQIAAARVEAAGLPADDASASAARGHVLAAEERWAQAAAQYRAALSASPADALAANALGYALMRAGRPGAAVEALRAAADLAPASAVIRNNLLLALTVAGRGHETEEMLHALPDAAALRARIAAEAQRLGAAVTP